MLEPNMSKLEVLPRIAKRLHSLKHLPRWAVLTLDVFIVIFSLLTTYFLMNLWGINHFGPYNDYLTFFILLFVTIVFLILFKVSSGVVRHSSINDLMKISLSTFSSLVFLFSAHKLLEVFTGKGLFYEPPLLFFILIVFLLLSLFRFYVKLIFLLFVKFKDDKIIKNIMIFGTNDDSVALGGVVSEISNNFNLVGFISDKEYSRKNRILGKPIYNTSKLGEFKLKGVDGILFSDMDMRSDDNQDLINDLIQHKIKLYHLSIHSFDEKKSETKELRKLEVEDLLYREEISIENNEVSKRHLNKNVLITGGAGSIGSEIVRKVAKFKPSLIVVVDQAETPLNDIKLEMEALYPDLKFIFHLADISNKYRVETLFKKYDFSMVYHAAAYKHVPMIEENPHEAIFVNIMGTRILADLSSEYNVNRFVMVSTDKAVNPTNVMGASKRVAEMYVQSLQTKEANTTKFITTRFGNVLGSNGSVIPLFRKQIEEGGPVTVTHKDITRFFMTIPEACELVLQAGIMGQGGEVYVFDMGEAVKILDLAKKMIKLSGFEPNVDIPIKITGLRPGEKLYEELLTEKSKTLKTHHEKIMRSKDETLAYEIMDQKTKAIARGTLRNSKMELVKMIKNIVPEYKSQNSEYECLDKSN